MGLADNISSIILKLIFKGPDSDLRNFILFHNLLNDADLEPPPPPHPALFVSLSLSLAAWFLSVFAPLQGALAPPTVSSLSEIRDMLLPNKEAVH